MESAIKDYKEYLKVGNNAEVEAFEETLEVSMMRLEEYLGTLNMIKAERTYLEENIFNQIDNMKEAFSKVVDRIDAMEEFISKVHHDMNTLETQLIEAEQDFPNTSETSLKSLLKPILSKVNPAESYSNSGMSSATSSSFEKVKVFSTDEMFKKN